MAKSYQPEFSIRSVLNQIKSEFPDQKTMLREHETALFRHRLLTSKAEKVSAWSHGKLYCIEEDKLFLVPTNISSVNHLDLEEFVMRYRFVENNVHLQRRARRNLFVDHSVEELVRCYFKKGRFSSIEDLATRAAKWSSSVIKKDSEMAALVSLLRDWNAKKHMQVMEVCLNSNSGIRRTSSDIYNFFFDILIACCTDSVAILETSDYMYKRIPDAENDKSTLRNIYLRCHVHLADFNPPLIWYSIPRKDLLSRAFSSGSIKIMKLGLELEWSSYYFNPFVPKHFTLQPIPDAVRVKETMWPRRKDGIQRESFYSIEYYLKLSKRIVRTASSTKPTYFTKCFKLFWRAIPTPYLPIEDMQRSVKVGWAGRSPEEKDRIWKLVAEAFADDFPTEFKPRSLKHLCRYVIRRQCRSPEQISSLDLPRYFKKYLLLEC